ncbi:hypothetical protein [Sedimentitalea nanhaiensis]|uniref:Uncharacterized protein n=1 Tax=Sedimentitalea nanhaiensis TaxID=999627 RepID=A0A1I7D0U4_9RHOB|nr:hypothetical protein [Sedimentitalea nanhaiensis]SFU05273.1 hypothetical protein SAMN05216236_12169 [Sedimentitalea nanhaiensis]
MGDIDIRFFIALLAPTIGFAIWFAKRLLDDRRAEQRRRQAQDNLMRALFAEIDFNTRDMEIFLEKSPSRADLRKALFADRNLVPHITDARHTEIYRNRIRDVHEISDDVLQQAVEFYGLLEKIRVQIEAINYPSFRTLSDEGRLNAVEVIRHTAEDARICGIQLLDAFQRNAVELKRYDRRAMPTQTPEQLRSRVEQLDKRLAEAASRQVKQ